MIADGQARQPQVAVLFGYGNQGKIGRASADVYNKNDIADFHSFAKSVTALFKPGIKRGLRFFKQCQVAKAGMVGRLHRKVARSGIERGGNGENDFLALDVGFS